MSIIIGSATTVDGFDGVVSVNWNMSPNIQRLWQLGSFIPYDTIKNFTQTLSVTVYGDGGPTIDIEGATSCVTSNVAFNCTVIPAACGPPVEGPSGKFFLTGYTYSKGNAQGAGQCTYNGQQWIDSPTSPEPTYVLCGGAEGTVSADHNIHGVVFSSTDAEGLQGSVSAGFPGLGNANITIYGIVSQVGVNPSAIDNGKIANANVTVKHQPLWL
jgi:hypothetical protein